MLDVADDHPLQAGQGVALRGGEADDIRDAGGVYFFDDGDQQVLLGGGVVR